MAFQYVIFLCFLLQIASSCTWCDWDWGSFTDNLTLNVGTAAPTHLTPSHRIDMCKAHRIVVSNGSNVHMLVGPSPYTVDYSYNRESYCVRVSEDCGVTALKSNQTIAVFQGSQLRCEINHTWVWNNFALSSDGSLIANPQCGNSTFEVAFYNSRCAAAYPSISLAVGCSAVLRTSFRKFFKGGSRLLAYLVKAEDVPTHDNRKSYVFIVALKDGQFAWEEVLTFNGDAIQAEISEGGETMVVQTTNETYVYRADAEGQLQLTEKLPYNGSEVTISKDGQKIFFSVDKKVHIHKWKKDKKKFTKVHQIDTNDTIMGLRLSLDAHLVFAALPTNAILYKICNQGQWANGSVCQNCPMTNCQICSSETVCAQCIDGFDSVDGRCVQITQQTDNRTWILGIIFIVFLACSLLILMFNTKMLVHHEKTNGTNEFDKIQRSKTMNKMENEIVIQ